MMAITYDTNRYKTRSGKKYYLSVDNTFGNETYSVHSFSDNIDFDNTFGPSDSLILTATYHTS